MAIYTKTGDDGTTGLYGERRVVKSDIQVDAYGNIDELSSFLGLVISKIDKQKETDFFTTIQKSLYEIMSVLAGTNNDLVDLNQQVKIFEQKIDKVQSQLPKLNSFIYPQGSELSSWFHILRTLTRRAERRIVEYIQDRSLKKETVIVKYLNRLSDLFFVMARFYNKDKEKIVKK